MSQYIMAVPGLSNPTIGLSQAVVGYYIFRAVERYKVLCKSSYSTWRRSASHTLFVVHTIQNVVRNLPGMTTCLHKAIVIGLLHANMSEMIPPTATATQVPLLNVDTNPYKAQRTWPPDFSKMDPKHQFRLERRYRRRSKLAWTRPRWNKGVKLAQWGSGLCKYTILIHHCL